MITRPLMLLAPDSPAVAAPPAPAKPAAPAVPLSRVPEAMKFPTPATTPTASEPSGDGDPWAHMDAPPTAPPEPAQATAKPAKPAEPAKAAATKPAEPIKPSKPAAEPPQTNAQLRAQYDTTKVERDSLNAEVASLRQQIAEAKKAGDSTVALAAELEAVKKERNGLNTELSIARYAPSDEVKAIQKELHATAQSAARMIQSLTVTDANGNETPARWDDFKKLVTTAEPGPAMAALRAQFGDNAQLAIQTYWDLKRISDRLDTASDEDRTGFQERVTRDTANRTAQQQQFDTNVARVEKELSDKNPGFLAPPADDEELSGAYKTGMDLANIVARPVRFAALSPAHQSIALARARLAVASLPMHQVMLRRKDDRIAALEKENSELRAGTSPETARPGGDSTGAKPEESFKEELDREAESWKQ